MNSDTERGLTKQRIRFFVDTSVLVSAVIEDEVESHEKATEFFKLIKLNNGLIIVSSLVMAEFFVSLFKKDVAIETIEKVSKNLLDAENFVVLNISDSQMTRVVAKVLTKGVTLKSSDLYISTTAMHFDSLYLTLDNQVYKNISKIYENTFCDPKKLAESLK